MKRVFTIIAVVVMALAVPIQMLAQQSKAEQEIRVVIEEMRQANLKGGAEAATIMDKYLADDFTRIPLNGAIYTKAEILDGYRTGKIKVEKYDLSDVKMHVYEKTAMVTGVANSIATAISAENSGQYRWARVFVKRDGIWKCTLNQSTRIAP